MDYHYLVVSDALRDENNKPIPRNSVIDQELAEKILSKRPLLHTAMRRIAAGAHPNGPATKQAEPEKEQSKDVDVPKAPVEVAKPTPPGSVPATGGATPIVPPNPPAAPPTLNK